MVARKKESPIFYLIGVPANFNLWGERSTSKYLLLKRGFSTYTRIVPARESPYFLCAMRQSLRVTSPNPISWVRVVCAGCAMRGVGCARLRRAGESESGRGRYGRHLPEDVEYYLCGPPMMAKTVLDLLHSLGVDDADIRFDNFGG